MPQRYRVGDPVIFIVSKISAQPGPRAQDVRPAPHGDTYNYIVEKYWRVRELLPDGRLMLMTRRGKTHTVDPDDPRLRGASWWERWFAKNRFPSLADSTPGEKQPTTAES